MQSIKNILTWEVLPAIALKYSAFMVYINVLLIPIPVDRLHYNTLISHI